MKNRTVPGLEFGWPTAFRQLVAIALAGVLGAAAPDVLAQATQDPAQQQQAPQQPTQQQAPQQQAPQQQAPQQQAPQQQAPQQQAPQQQAPQQQAPQGKGAPAEGTITEQHFKDWTVRCGRRAEQDPPVCEMQQQQIDQENRTIMAVAVGKVPASSDLGLLIILPLGILLPAGVTLQIDGAAAVPLEVDRCERQGCRIEMLLEPDLLGRLKAGTKATVFFEAIDPQGERRRLGVPISLLGFTAALNQVTS